MNLIFRRCLKMLNLTMIKRDYYDSEARVSFPVSIHRFEKSIADYDIKYFLHYTELQP